MEVFVSNFSGQSLLKPLIRKKQPSNFRKHELSVFLLAVSANRLVDTIYFHTSICHVHDH